MDSEITAEQVARALQLSIRLLNLRLRQHGVDDELAVPEASVLARLDRLGPLDAASLARAEGISPQSVGATVASLQRRGLVRREADATDRRRLLLNLTREGAGALARRRTRRADQLAAALEAGFSAEELRQLFEVAPLIERLAEGL